MDAGKFDLDEIPPPVEGFGRVDHELEALHRQVRALQGMCLRYFDLVDRMNKDGLELDKTL